MESVPADLLEQLRRHRQDHVLAWWDELSLQERHGLIEQLRGVDLTLLSRLYSQRDDKGAIADQAGWDALPWPRSDDPLRSTHHRRGEEAMRAGQVAFLVVAGGQGSRLGFERPKGMFPVGPVSGKSLFQILAEKILALSRRYHATLPFLVMTSPATDAETRAFFAEHHCFGLPAEDVWFFCQGTMPALDLASGRLLMESKGRLFLSPNGHGGTLTGLADSGMLERLEHRGVRTVFYFQVDNPLVDLADVTFVGQHLAHDAALSTKVLPKIGPMEKVGNFVVKDGRLTIIEYSDLKEDLARKVDEQGRLFFWAANPAIHLFGLEALRRATQGDLRIPYHIARKKVPCLNEAGELVEPTKENALKFEMFIFDVFPQARRWAIAATTRAHEFEPLKNADGENSPATVRQAISDLAATWLHHAGVQAPRDEKGHSVFPLEISPLLALDQMELALKIPPQTAIEGPRYFG